MPGFAEDKNAIPSQLDFFQEKGWDVHELPS